MSNKIKALFSINPEILLENAEMEKGEELSAFKNESGWLHNSGIFLDEAVMTDETVLSNGVLRLVIKDSCPDEPDMDVLGELFLQDTAPNRRKVALFKERFEQFLCEGESEYGEEWYSIAESCGIHDSDVKVTEEIITW